MKSKDLETLIETWNNFGYKHHRADDIITFETFDDANSLAARMSSNSEFIWDVFSNTAEILLLAACTKYAKCHIPEQSMKFELNEDVTFLFAPIESGRPLNSLDNISMKGVKSIGYRPTIHELCWVADTILKNCNLKLEDVYIHTCFENSRSRIHEDYQIKTMMSKLPDVYPTVSKSESPAQDCKPICPDEEEIKVKQEKKLYAEN